MSKLVCERVVARRQEGVRIYNQFTYGNCKLHAYKTENGVWCKIHNPALIDKQEKESNKWEEKRKNLLKMARLIDQYMPGAIEDLYDNAEELHRLSYEKLMRNDWYYNPKGD